MPVLEWGSYNSKHDNNPFVFSQRLKYGNPQLSKFKLMFSNSEFKFAHNLQKSKSTLAEYSLKPCRLYMIICHTYCYMKMKNKENNQAIPTLRYNMTKKMILCG